MRVVFLGPEATTAAHALHVPAGGLVPRFIDVRERAEPRRLRAALASVAPHVVIALAPEFVPPEALAGLPAATLAVGGAETHRQGYDRILRLPGPSAGGEWRSRPLPVDDRLFLEVRTSRWPPRALALGRSTEHREWVLMPAKHSYDVVHYTHGLVGEALVEVLTDTDIGIALTAEAAHGFPSQALIHLAAGHLLLTEHLEPGCGLEPGIDFLELDSRDSLNTILMQLRLRPESYERVRIRGRLKAEQHRASKVWPRIVRDLLHDIRVFGPSIP